MKMILNRKARYIIVLSLILGAIFLFTAVQIVNALDYPNSDFFSFWLAGRMIGTGENPYSSAEWIDGHHQYGATWISDTKFLYPLPLAIFLAPLGLFSLYHAYIIWVFSIQLMIAITIQLLFSTRQDIKIRYFILSILAGIVLFRPTIITLLNGQLSGFLLLICAGIIYLWEKDRWWQGSVLLPLLALKPNIGIPILAFITLWLLIKKQGRMLGWIAISGVILIVIGLVRDLHWISEYLIVGNTKIAQTFGYSPTVWGLAAYITDFKQIPTIIYGSLMAIGLSTGCIYLLIRARQFLDPAIAISLIITTALLITPYTWPYDQLVLMIPIIIIMLEMIRRHYPFLLTGTFFLLIDILALVLLAISANIQMEVLNVLLPLAIYGILLAFIPSQKSQPQINNQLS